MRATLLPALRAALDASARADRRALLAALEAWAPVMTMLGDDAAALDTIDALDEVGQLWP